ncbi:MAG: hypothetical protein L0Z62_47870 [Gemmataceae bacterium]|nr:hypothetical protein [Gemmataceae bacterium]
MGIELSAESAQVLVAFGCYLIGVAALGVFAHRYLSRGSFVKEYFLGNRGLGPWVLALTVAATAISGGTFMGFPSLIYTNGWVMALWIASYMVVPITTMALMGKRINQVARLSGAVTVPDVLRDRFDSPSLGILATLLILIMAAVNLVAQFKGGAIVMQAALQLPRARGEVQRAEVDDRDKRLVVHFRLAEGGSATQKAPLPDEHAHYVILGWEALPKDEPDHVIVRLAMTRTKSAAALAQAQAAAVAIPGSPAGLAPAGLLAAASLQPIARRISFPEQRVTVPVVGATVEKGYLIGLVIFALTVVAYTTYGGFWAVTWTDVLEGLVMLVGVLVMAVLAVRVVAPVTVAHSAPAPSGQGTVIVQEQLHGLPAATETLRRQDPALVYGPGPGNYLPIGLAFSFFLMWSLMGAGQPSGMVRLMSFKDSASVRRALLLICGYYVLTYMSLLIIFTCARAIYPTEFLRQAGSEALGEPDRIMPEMTRKVTAGLPGGPFWAGLLLAAPYAAIMSTVAAFLLMISSSLVRDLYQRVINPRASNRAIKVGSYLVTGLIGVIVMIGALNPPNFLQYIIVFSGTGLGCSFLVPMLLTLYSKRATRAGVIAAMLGGALTVASLYVLGWLDSGSRRSLRDYEATRAQAQPGQPAPVEPGGARWLQDNLNWIPGWGEQRHDPFLPLFVGGVDTLVWGLLVSLVLGVGVSLATRPDPLKVEKYFPGEAP